MRRNRPASTRRAAFHQGQIAVRLALSLIVALSVACAGKQQFAPVAQLSPERAARCRVVADSVFANVVPERLPLAGPATSRPPTDLMRLPASVPAGVPVRTNFLIRPDGTGDTASVVITGTDDARFRRDAIEMVSRARLTPADVDGCPVWSQTTIVTVKSPVVRQGSPPPSTRTAQP